MPMRLILALIIILPGIFLYGCGESVDRQAKKTELKVKPVRVSMVTGLKPEKMSYYKELHAKAWDGVLMKLRECNIRDYSINLHKIDGKYFLFSYYEYIGNDYAGDMKRIAEDSVTQRWWRETDPCQIPLPEAAAQNKIWSEMEEVFYAE